tara:strand:+ start:1292 stop:1609 length:318 start_codon:yes stop_codon:yes gene_type:complete
MNPDHHFESYELREIDADSGHTIKIYVRRDNPNPCARMWQKAYAALGNSPRHSIAVRIRKPHEHGPPFPALPDGELDWREYARLATIIRQKMIHPTNNPQSTPFD